MKIPSAVVLVLCVLAGSCGPGASPESLMRKGNHRGTPKEEATGLALAQYAANGENPPGLRCWSLRALSRFRVQHDENVKLVGSVLTNKRNNPILRSWAAYALGEMRAREAIPLFIDALGTIPDDATSYFVLEGLGKVVSLILEDVELNTRLVQTMTTFAGASKKEVPAIYDLLNEHVINLVVLAITMETLLTSPESRSDRDTVYTAIYRALHYIENSLTQFLTTYAQNRESLTRIMTLSFSTASARDRHLWALTGWYTGVLGGNAELAEFCSNYIIQWFAESPPPIKLILAWSLARMTRHSEQAAQALATMVFTSVSDQNTMRMFARMTHEKGQLDVFQQALGVRLQAAPEVTP